MRPIRIGYVCAALCAGVPGLEPRLSEPESLVLPITPYPMGVTASRIYLFPPGFPWGPYRWRTLPDLGRWAKRNEGAVRHARPFGSPRAVTEGSRKARE